MKKLLPEIKLWLRVTFDPNYWARCGSYDRQWDRFLRSAIEKDLSFEVDFVASDGSIFSVWCLGEEIWVPDANYPYSYGRNQRYRWMPSRRTTLLLKQKLDPIIKQALRDTNNGANRVGYGRFWREAVVENYIQ